MSSFNIIEKIQYFQETDDPVGLEEYVNFQDDINKQKFIVLKFSNRLKQSLREIQYEISQYDIHKNLIEKEVITYKDFSAAPEGTFVPEAKLQVDYLCQTISAKLLFAKFENVAFDHGEFVPVTYTANEFSDECKKHEQMNVPASKKAVKQTKKSSGTKIATVVHQKPKKAPKKVPKKGRGKVRITNVMKSHKSRPAVFFGILLPILSLACCLYLTISYTRSTSVWSDGDFNYKYVNEDQTEVALVSYTGFDKTVTIPNMVGEAKLVSIESNAFENRRLEKLIIQAEKVEIKASAFSGCKKLLTVKDETTEKGITLGANAFSKCTSLRSISSNNITLVSTCAFNNCSSLKNVNLSNAEICSAAFIGCDSLSILEINDYNSSIDAFYEIFGNSYTKIPTSLYSLSSNVSIAKKDFYRGASYISTLTFKNPDIEYEAGCLRGLESLVNGGNDGTFDVLNDTIIGFTSSDTIVFSDKYLGTSSSLLTKAKNRISGQSTSIQYLTLDSTSRLYYNELGNLSQLRSLTLLQKPTVYTSFFDDCNKLSMLTLDSPNYNLSSIFNYSSLSRIKSLKVTNSAKPIIGNIISELPNLSYLTIDSASCSDSDVYQLMTLYDSIQVTVIGNIQDYPNSYERFESRLTFIQ